MIVDLSPRNRWHPDRWSPTASPIATSNRPEVGQLIAWRYATWRVLEVTPRADVDLSDEDRTTMNGWKSEYRDTARPYAMVIRHERGPILIDQPQRLHDGTVTVHLGIPAGRRQSWHIVDERYAVCACCNHPHPCQEYAMERVADAEAERLARLLDSHAPGVCMACREPVTTRQKVIVFPEPSPLVPGAPGPTFHANRWECWRGARSYELGKRLPAYPNAARLASCPGLLFRHEGSGREECTAERLCTGMHGPKGNRGMSCFTRTYMFGVDGGYPRPPSDCGYRQHGACLGADLSLGGPDPFTVGDEIDRSSWSRR